MSSKLIALMFSVGLVYACGGATPGTQSPGGGGGGKAQKGGGEKGAAAKGSGQHVGEHASGDKSKATDHGSTFEDVGCDAQDEGLAWCDSERELAFCSGGEWWTLDCTHPDIDGDFCGDTGTTVDCYVASDF